MFERIRVSLPAWLGLGGPYTITHVYKNVTHLIDQSNAIRRDLTTMSEQLNTKLNELQAEVGDIGQSFVDLLAAFTAFQSDQDRAVVALREERDRLVAEGTADKATIAVLNDAIATHDAAMSEAVDRVGEITGEAQAVDANIDAATDRYDGEPTPTTTTTPTPEAPDGGQPEGRALMAGVTAFADAKTRNPA